MMDISKDNWLNFRIDGNAIDTVKNMVVPILDENCNKMNGFYFLIESSDRIRVHIRGEEDQIEKVVGDFKIVISTLKDITSEQPERNRQDFIINNEGWESYIKSLECGSKLAILYWKNKRPDISDFLHAFLNGVGFPYPEEIRVSASYIINVAEWYKRNYPDVPDDVIKEIQQKSDEIITITSKI